MRPAGQAAVALLLVSALRAAAARGDTLSAGRFEVFHGPGRRQTAAFLLDRAPVALDYLAEEFGRRYDFPVTIVLLDPAGPGVPETPAWMPPWLSGVATGDDRIYLRTAASLPGGAADIRRALAHELTHLYLRRRTDAHPLPRWFEEGLAVRQAGPPLLGDRVDLSLTAARGALPPLAAWRDAFPAGEDEARVAYAASADFVLHLRDLVGRHGIRRLLDQVARGTPFPAAFRVVLGGSQEEVEQSWRRGFVRRSRLLLLLAGGGSTWAFATVVFLLVSWRKRVISKRRLAAMEEEERLLFPDPPD